MISEARKESRRCTRYTLDAKVVRNSAYLGCEGRQEQCLLQCGVATADHGNFLVLEEEAIAGTYNSVSIDIVAQNFEQVETLYKELAKVEGVKMVL